MKRTTLILSLALLFVCNIQAQTTWTVDNTIGANAQYDNLQDAIDDAGNNDILYVHASSTNYSSIEINKPLTIIGYGHSNPLKNTLISEIKLKDNASGTKISGVYISSQIVCENTVAILQNLIFEYNYIGLIDFNDNTYLGANNVMVRGNVFNNIWGDFTNTIISNNVCRNKVYVDENYISVEIKNNVFFTPSSGSRVPVVNYDNASGSITVQNNILYNTGSSNMNSPGVIFENCLTYAFGGGTPTALMGSNNIDNQDPLFVSADDGVYDADTDDYHLQVGSPAIGQGAGGVDIGLYPGGPFVFNNFGCTVGVPKVEIIAITNEVAPGGNVEVTIQSSSN